MAGALVYDRRGYPTRKEECQMNQIHIQGNLALRGGFIEDLSQCSGCAAPGVG